MIENIAGSTYVVWNGTTLREYRWDGMHDCTVAIDRGVISVQRVREFFLRHNIEVIVYFACQAGQPAAEVNTPDHGWQGLATYCRLGALEENPSITIRDLVTRANAIAWEMGFDQVAEVLCREDMLDRPYFSRPGKGTGGEDGPREDSKSILGDPTCENSKAIAFMSFDMCRTRGNPHDYVIGDDEFSPK